MQQLIKGINQINEFAGRLVAWITSVLVLLICYDVMMRYLFQYTKIWIVELEWHFFALIFLLGVAYTFLYDRHVRVDVFYNRYTEKGKAWLNLLGTLFLLLPLCITVLITSFDFTAKSLAWGEKSADPGGLSQRWLIKGSIFVGFALLCLQAISYAFNNLLIILGHTPVSSPQSSES